MGTLRSAISFRRSDRSPVRYGAERTEGRKCTPYAQYSVSHLCSPKETTGGGGVGERCPLALETSRDTILNWTTEATADRCPT